MWLEATNIKTDRVSHKLDDRRYGPFPVVKKVGVSAYKLKLPKGWKRIHPVFNESLLSPYNEPVAAHQKRPPPPPATMIGGELEHNVEEILAVRKRRNRFEWNVKWEGYGREENTWEPLDHLEHATKRLADFYKKYPDEPRPAGLQLRRSIFPRDILPDDFFDPLTTGIDESLPSEAFLHRWAMTRDPHA